MKKISILFWVGLLGLVSNAWADVENMTKSTWVIQENGDTSFPTGRLANNVNQGWGGEGSIGYRLPIDLEFSVESGYDTYSARNNSFNSTWNVVPLVFKIQYGFGTGSIKPYLFIGAGIAFNAKTNSSDGSMNGASEADFLDEGGFGLDFALLENSSFFVQGKMETDYTSSNYASDQPTVLFPLNAGFKFALD
jgi:hypothetical protein